MITRTLELGTKGNLFADQLLMSSDDSEEKQQNDLIYTTTGTYAQISEERVRGVEVSANGSITESWNMIAGFSHLDAVIVSGGGQRPVSLPR